MNDADADPKSPLPDPADQPARCASCDAPLLPDQRYCLECGARRGVPRLDFTGFWQRAGAGAAGTAGAAASTASGTPERDGAGAPRRMPLPSRKASAALACVVLAVGIAAGDLIGPGPASSLASSASSLPVGVLGAIAAAESTRKAKSTASIPAAEAEASPEEASLASGEAEEPAAAEVEPEAIEEAPEEAAPSGEEATESTGTGSGASGSKKSESSKGSSATEAPVSNTVLSQIQHVWVIALSGSSFQRALAKPSSDPYLAKKLVPQGTLLSSYSLVAASPLANDVALLAGQGGNPATEEDCPTYEPIEPPTVEAKGLTEGVGCIYPAAAKTLADQTTEAALTWKAYVQDIVSGETSATFAQTTSTTTTSAATSESATSTTTTSSETVAGQTTSTEAASTGAATTQTCRHPAIGGAEAAQTAAAGADYLDYRNPFVFFDSLLESGACASDDVGLAALKPALAETKTTPNLSWIVPSACDDGESTSCGRAGSSGLAAADDFLHEVVPEITASSAYKQHGLILITFDAGPEKHAEAGAKVGALLVSPFVKRGTDARSFDTYSLLKSLERIYGVPLLGHANDEGLEELGAGVYSTTAKAAQAAASSRHGAMQPSG